MYDFIKYYQTQVDQILNIYAMPNLFIAFLEAVAHFNVADSKINLICKKHPQL